jgi:hypothetical protein
MNESGTPGEFHSPPWGEGREALTARERQHLVWLLGVCLATDAALVLLLNQALG